MPPLPPLATPLPYSFRHRYWTGLLLLVRALLFLVSAINTSGNPQVPLMATILTVVCLLVIASRGVYKKAHVNCLELSMLLNIGVITSLTWYATDVGDSLLHNSATYLSVTTSQHCSCIS